MRFLLLMVFIWGCDDEQVEQKSTRGEKQAKTEKADVKKESAIVVEAAESDDGLNREVGAESSEASGQSAGTDDQPIIGRAAKLTEESCVDPDLTKVSTETSLMLCDGTVVSGQYVAPNLTNLTAANIKNGVVINGITGTHQDPQPDLTNLTAGNVKAGVTIAGVTGTVVAESHTDCNANNQTGCIATSQYKAADLTNLVAGNIKAGASIAGVSGQYPSTTYPLTNADSTNDLDLATFDIRMKSATAFEWFDANGTRYSRSGDTDITETNIRTGVTVFGAVGTLQESVSPDPWNLRAGVTVGSSTGVLQPKCGSPGITCSGSNWVDVTLDDYGNAANCTAVPDNCMYLDKVSGLTWARGFDGTKSWADAVAYCSGLTFNGYSDWRIPTRAELQMAVIQKISVTSNNLFPDGRNGYWAEDPSASIVRVDTGLTPNPAGTSVLSTTCVR